MILCTYFALLLHVGVNNVRHKKDHHIVNIFQLLNATLPLKVGERVPWASQAALWLHSCVSGPLFDSHRCGRTSVVLLQRDCIALPVTRLTLFECDLNPPISSTSELEVSSCCCFLLRLKCGSEVGEWPGRFGNRREKFDVHAEEPLEEEPFISHFSQFNEH